jgi:hypothetical protein
VHKCAKNKEIFCSTKLVPSTMSGAVALDIYLFANECSTNVSGSIDQVRALSFIFWLLWRKKFGNHNSPTATYTCRYITSMYLGMWHYFFMLTMLPCLGDLLLKVHYKSSVFHRRIRKLGYFIIININVLIAKMAQSC